MRLGLRIVALVVAAALSFVALAMLEEWSVFEPWLAGESVALPEASEVEPALWQFARELETGGLVGAPGSMAQLGSREDLAFRRRFGVEQQLVLQTLEVEGVVRAGPESVRTTTRERSRLVIGREGGMPRTYDLVGRWQYTLAQPAMQVTDVLPLEVELVVVEAR